MNLLSILVFVAFEVYLYLGAYVWRLDPKARLNQSFAWFCGSLGYWAIVQMFVYPAADSDGAMALFRLSSLGWCTFTSFALYFVLNLTHSRFAAKRWLLPALLVPSAVLSWRAMTGTLTASGFVFSPLGWCEVSAPGGWMMAYVAYVGVCFTAGLGLLWHWGAHTRDPSEGRQARIIAFGWVVSAVLMFVPNIVFPALGMRLVPSVGAIGSLAFAYAIWHAIVRCRLMSLTAAFAADAIIAKIADMTVLVSPEGTVLQANPSACRMLGAREQELKSRSALRMFDQAGTARDGFAQLLARPAEGLRGEIGWLTSHGESIPVDTSAAAVTDRKGEVIGVVVVGHDLRPQKQLEHELVERKRIAEELREASTAAEAASRAKSTFLANMSHELRTPLNAVIGYSELLKEDAQENGLHRSIDDLNRISAAGRHLLSLISDILDLSKIEAGKMEVRFEDFALSEIAREVADAVRPLADKNGDALELRVGPGVGRMWSDATKVRQVLFNLLSNACKFTHQGKVTLTVDPEESDGRPWVRIAVTDTGIGIPEQQVGRLFQAFMQADSSSTRKYGGTGLGLAITKRFCELLGGDIVVTSELGRGSTFVVTLPTQATTVGSSVAAESGASQGTLVGGHHRDGSEDQWRSEP